MIKKLKYILCAGLFGLTMHSCYDLDLEPKGIMGENTFLGNEYGVSKYFSGIYNLMPVEDFNYDIIRGWRYPDYQNSYWQPVMQSLSGNAAEWSGRQDAIHGDGFAYWPYDYIRDINTFIYNFPSYRNNFDEGTYNSLLGEAHFLRAFYYFALAKRYGGVPLIDVSQDPTASEEVLNVSRATESATWRFVHDDLEIAINNMKRTSDRGRANRYAAAALMSRAMLYAGSIAKYGEYSNMGGQASELGLVGIPAGEAEYFFEESYKASKLIISEGGYSFYKNSGDKEQDYVDLFLDNQSSEDILIKEYGKNSPHNTQLKFTYDCLMLPGPDFSSWGHTTAYPTYDIADLFEHKAIEDADGKPVRFNSREEFLEGMEPRLKAIIYFSGMKLREKAFDMRRGFYVSYPGTVADAAMGANDAPANSAQNRILGQTHDTRYNGEIVSGRHGYIEAKDEATNTRTGMFVRKYIDYKQDLALVTVYGDEHPWKIFRLGEIYVNHAEAAYELGLLRGEDELKREAFDYIALLRQRAGASAYSYKATPEVNTDYGYELDENLQFIRDERERELCFENHRWWDLRRWRTADTEFKNFVPTSLMAYKVLDEGKYIFLKEKEPWNKTWFFEKKWYYEPIPVGEIGKNPNLNPQNPLY